MRPTLSDLLDQIGQHLGHLLPSDRGPWPQGATIREKRRQAIFLLSEYPILWVWDDVHVLTSSTSADDLDQINAPRDLINFLMDIRARTCSRILITTRNAGIRWLQNVPLHLAIPAMPIDERIDFAASLAGHDSAAADVDWRTIVRLTGGNPIAIMIAGEIAHKTALTGPANADDLTTQIAENIYLDKTVTTEGAEIQRFYEDHFDALGAERMLLMALLGIFKRFVHRGVLKIMGDRDLLGSDVLP
jgi:hypothetical protein